jgi:hypothetical protein
MTDHRDPNSGRGTPEGPDDELLLDLLALCARWLVQNPNPQAFVLAPQFDLWRADPAVRQWLQRLLDAGEPGSAATADLFGPDTTPTAA